MLCGSRAGQEATTMKVHVDTEICSGHGRCYTLAPEVFEADENGHSSVISIEVPESLRDKAEIGRDNCPERAITIED
jgi:ferredoxin